MSRAEELLGELGISAAEGPAALESLLLRFEARVPHETGAEYPRDPEAVFADFLEGGRGTDGGERVRAVAALAHALGFPPQPLRGVRRSEAGDEPHAALLFGLPRGEALAAPAFPLPGLVPVGAEGIPGAWGALHLARRGDAHVLEIEALGERREALVLSPAGEEAFEIPRPAPGRLVRLFDDRVVRWEAGLARVRDAWSLLTHPLSDRGTLERLFGVAPEEAPPARDEPARLAVFLASALPAAELRERVARPEGLHALATPGLAVAEIALEPDGWSWMLAAEGAPARRARIRRTPEGLFAEDADGPFVTRRWIAEPRGAGARLALEAVLRAPAPRGLAESVRRTMVFHLAAELLAWGRGS